MDFRYDPCEDELEIFDSKDITLEGEDRTLHVSMMPDEIKALRDYLDTELEQYQATRRRILPEEPPANGFYTTSNGIRILHNENGFWSVFDTSDGMAHVERARWAEACECLTAGMLAGPLTRIMPIDFIGGAK